MILKAVMHSVWQPSNNKSFCYLFDYVKGLPGNHKEASAAMPSDKLESFYANARQ